MDQSSDNLFKSILYAKWNLNISIDIQILETKWSFTNISLHLYKEKSIDIFRSFIPSE